MFSGKEKKCSKKRYFSSEDLLAHWFTFSVWFFPLPSLKLLGVFLWAWREIHGNLTTRQNLLILTIFRGSLSNPFIFGPAVGWDENFFLPDFIRPRVCLCEKRLPAMAVGGQRKWEGWPGEKKKSFWGFTRSDWFSMSFIDPLRFWRVREGKI